MNFGALIVETQLGQLSEPQSSHPENGSANTAVLMKSVTLCSVLIKEPQGTARKVQARRCPSACPSATPVPGRPTSTPSPCPVTTAATSGDSQRTGYGCTGVAFREAMVNGIAHEYILMEQ